MNDIICHTDFSKLQKILNHKYNLGIENVTLHRDMIGYVYIVEADSRKYILKIYRPFNTHQAMQSINLISYLRSSGYPVVTIVPTQDAKMYIDIDTPEGQCVGILYDYIDGSDVDRVDDLQPIGEQVAWLHNLMDGYDGELKTHGKEFFIDRYIDVLRELSYNSSCIDDFARYGDELWSRIEGSSCGFCHGDIHTGNMFKMGDGSFTIFDFDVTSYSHSIIDVAILSDGSDFNRLESDALDKTRSMFDRFYRGYSKKRVLTDSDIAVIPSFVATRHYEIIATITECQGINSLSKAFLDEQYDWLMRWRDMCDRDRF